MIWHELFAHPTLIVIMGLLMPMATMATLPTFDAARGDVGECVAMAPEENIATVLRLDGHFVPAP